MDGEQSQYRMQESVARIVHNLRFAKTEGISCTLLIGAGCSYTAGIPLASEFVKIIKGLFPPAYNRAIEEACERAKRRGQMIDVDTFVPTYSNCMAELPPIFRRQLFAKYVDNAKVNRAHICIASLLKAGYVDRILTTNFDPLIVQACALLGEYPAVYDFASSQHLKPHSIPAKAVFHLHGQRTGFVQLNTEDELEKHSAVLGPLMQAARNGRTWVVAGYSGENDPVFEHISNFQMDSELFWVGYQMNDPRPHIQERLLNKKNAYYVKGYDADTFFAALTKQLGIFPPDLIARPFSHLAKFLDAISPKEEFVREARQLIKRAIGQFEKPPSISIITGDFSRTLIPNAAQQVLDDDLQSLIANELHSQSARPVYSDHLAWAYMILGNLLSNRASTKCGAEADKLFSQAAERYQTALGHKPQYDEAINNWGVSLYYQAKTKSGEEAKQLFKQAEAKFQEALTHKPHYYEALNNQGAALYELAKNESGDETKPLLNLAVKNFKDALELEPNLYQAYNNWGNVILQQCSLESEERGDQVFEESKKKFEKALYIESDQLQILNNWGMALLERRRVKRNDEIACEELENEIIKVSGRAEKVKPGGGSYLSACLSALIGDESGCRWELRKALKWNTLPPREFLLKDPNLESMRDSELFIEFINDAFKPGDRIARGITLS